MNLTVKGKQSGHRLGKGELEGNEDGNGSDQFKGG